jgi:hypothetical protein
MFTGKRQLTSAIPPGEEGTVIDPHRSLAMTCTYFNKADRKLHMELIPDGEYK